MLNKVQYKHRVWIFSWWSGAQSVAGHVQYGKNCIYTYIIIVRWNFIYRIFYFQSNHSHEMEITRNM